MKTTSHLESFAKSAAELKRRVCDADAVCAPKRHVMSDECVERGRSGEKGLLPKTHPDLYWLTPGQKAELVGLFYLPFIGKFQFQFRVPGVGPRAIDPLSLIIDGKQGEQWLYDQFEEIGFPFPPHPSGRDNILMHDLIQSS